jgi:hypothetical protein
MHRSTHVDQSLYVCIQFTPYMDHHIALRVMVHIRALFKTCFSLAARNIHTRCKVMA